MFKCCDFSDEANSKKKLCKIVFYACLASIGLLLFAILLVYLILRPTTPRFTLQNVTVYRLNVSNNNSIMSTLQVTIASRNSNQKVGVYYDKLDIFVSYRGQQITLANSMQSTYQGHNDVNVWSPFIYGVSQPIAPYLAVDFAQDQAAGMILVNIKIDGRVRWKVGTWISGRYHLYVNCPAYLEFTDMSDASGLKISVQQHCSTAV